MKDYTNKKIKADYTTGVYKPNLSAWRTEIVSAILQQVSPKSYLVTDVTSITGHGGSKRQDFYTNPIEKREKGKIKRHSSLFNITAL